MENEASKLRIPGDVPTLGEVDQARIFHAERSATYSHDKENMQQFNDKSQRRFRWKNIDGQNPHLDVLRL